MPVRITVGTPCESSLHFLNSFVEYALSLNAMGGCGAKRLSPLPASCRAARVPTACQNGMRSGKPRRNLGHETAAGRWRCDFRLDAMTEAAGPRPPGVFAEFEQRFDNMKLQEGGGIPTLHFVQACDNLIRIFGSTILCHGRIIDWTN